MSPEEKLKLTRVMSKGKHGFVEVDYVAEDDSSDSECDAAPQPLMAPQEDNAKCMNPEKFAAGFLEKLEKSKLVPSFVKPHLGKLKATIHPTAQVLRIVSKYIDLAWKLALEPMIISLAQHNAHILLPGIIGLLMIMYGGSLTFLIAAVEAYRLSGWDLTRKCINDLYRNYRDVVEADTDDDNNLRKKDPKDGKSLEDRMTDEEYLTHKVNLMLAVVKPQQVIDAVSGLSAGFCGVVAALKIKFAEYAFLGTAIAQMFETVFNELILEDLEDTMGDKHKEWAKIIINYTCRGVGMWVAYTFSSIDFAFHSSLRGAHLVMYTAAEITGRKFNSLEVEVVKICLGILGFVKQVAAGFAMPFVLKFLLWPFLVADWFLFVCVGSASSGAAK